jgi:hypothetical protein
MLDISKLIHLTTPDLAKTSDDMSVHILIVN